MGGGKLGIDFLPGLLGTAVFSKIFRYLSYLTHISSLSSISLDIEI